MYDYSKLRGRIVEICGTNSAFAEAMGLSERTISNKMQQRLWWKQTEIEKALGILNLAREDIQPYFFTIKVQY